MKKKGFGLLTALIIAGNLTELQNTDDQNLFF